MGIENEKNKFNMQAEIKRALDSIRNVGPAKPVGYLPIETITDYCNSNVEELISECEAKGLRIVIPAHTIDFSRFSEQGPEFQTMQIFLCKFSLICVCFYQYPRI